MNKGLISDEIIQDILGLCRDKDVLWTPKIKEGLKKLGYEVEKEKTVLDKVREFYNQVIKIIDKDPRFYENDDSVVGNFQFGLLKCQYEKAIEEQQKEIDKLKNRKINQINIDFLNYIKNNMKDYFYNSNLFSSYAESILKQLGEI